VKASMFSLFQVEEGEVLVDSRGKGSLQKCHVEGRGRSKISLKKANFI
jgi:hypothetical protein